MCATRLTVVLLLIVMLLASCGKTGSAENSDTSVQNDVATETEAETEAEDPIASRTLKDDVPDKNFNGADFRVLFACCFKESQFCTGTIGNSKICSSFVVVIG